MKFGVLVVVSGLVGVPAFAQEPLGLLAEPLDCAALESLVVYGLIDGGIDGDTTELTELLNGGDGAACLARLSDYGYAAGFADEDCRTAFDVMARGWFQPTDEMTLQDAIRLILTAPTPMTCDDILFDMTAGL